MEQVAVSLKKGRLITAVKGAKGGYQFAGGPADITAPDVLQTAENILLETAQNKPFEQAPAVCDALSALIFKPLGKVVENCLSGITSRGLPDYTLNHGDSQSFMSYISL